MIVSNDTLSFLKHAVLASVIATGLGCASPAPERATLADLDESGAPDDHADAPFRGQINDADAKSAYYEFLHKTPDHDHSRNRALARLAELELQESERWTDQDDYQEDQRYRDTLERTIDLLTLALEEFPEAPGNARKLYQLAKSHDLLGQSEPSLKALEQLVLNHPQSDLYPEAQFRLAEAAFSQGDFLAAEIAYTAALHSSQNTGFHERALFKRGWARYKQSLYEPALEDYIAVIHAQSFPSLAAQTETPLSAEQQVIYDEYYRSLALAMLQYDQPNALARVFRKHGLHDLYAPYYASSLLLESQERTSDAVAQWQALIEAEVEPELALRARTHIVELWQNAGFIDAALNASETTYRAYQQKVAERDTSAPLAEQTHTALRQQWKQAARHYHGLYQQETDEQHLHRAQQWYQRYLEHFSGYAQQDGIALAYGDLLAEAGQTEAAYAQYERAAFDGNVILNQDGAYAALALLDELTEQNARQWLPKNLRHARAFAQLYPDDERTAAIAWQAARHAFREQEHDAAIELAEFVLGDQSLREDAYALTLQSHLNQKRYPEAEQVAQRMLTLPELSDEARKLTEQRWALSVYRQAEQAENSRDWRAAIHHFQRIHEQYPAHDNAARGLYNALSLSADQDDWDTAIALIHRFQEVYPEHSLRPDAERQLSTAYLASGQSEQAARQYERLADSEQDGRAQRAAQWKAAQLYLEQEDQDAAINAFRRYAHRYPEPYPQNAEAMNHLITLYTQTGAADKRAFWQRRLLTSEQQQTDAVKTDRTRRLAATAALGLGRDHHEQFRNTPLRLPLDTSLAQKTEHMQNAIQHYARASSYGLTDISSESTHQIGRIYETLARDLLDSERPTELSAEALMQYDILLEDRAFPFEDKAIEFYERNLRRARSSAFNEWLAKSRKRLSVLFPVRYDREPRIQLRFSHRSERTDDTAMLNTGSAHNPESHQP